MTRERLIEVYRECLQNDFEYCLNAYVTETNKNVKKEEEFLDFFKVLQEIVEQEGDKYDYEKVLIEKGYGKFGV